MLFRYKAVTANGKIVHGQQEALNLAELDMQLARRQLELLSGHAISFRLFFSQGRIPRRELIHFCFQLSHLIQAGVPLLECLADLRDTLEQSPWRTIISALNDDIAGGQTLSQAMHAHPGAFSPVFINLIRAGESSGRLPEVLEELTESLKWEDELRAHSRKLLLYPILVGSIVLAATAFLMIKLVPQLRLFINSMGQLPPLHTRLLFDLSEALITWWPLFLAAPLFAVLAWRFYAHIDPLAQYRLDALKLKLPMIGPILQKIILTRVAGNLAMLYASGITLIDALHTLRDIAGNKVMHQALAGVEQSIRNGQQIATAFHDEMIFPPLVIRMLRIGESTGNLDKALLNISYFYNRDIRESIAKAQTLIEPVLTSALGLLLGWIMLAVIAPIYDIVGQVAL